MYINIIPFICATVMMISGANATDNQNTPDAPHHDKHFEMGIMMDMPRPTFMMDGPMPPRKNMAPGPIEKLNLSEKQSRELKKLGRQHHDDIKRLHAAREELREKYLEKFESILTDEQFRKIDAMRKDLRREMKKLNDKRDDLYQRHRQSFESILNPEQKKELHRIQQDRFYPDNHK